MKAEELRHSDKLQVIQTKYGLEVVIPDFGANSEFRYQLRQVATLNADLMEQEKDLISMLDKIERKHTKKFIKLADEMAQLLKLQSIDKYAIGRWERANKEHFNYYFHDQMANLENVITRISQHFCEKSQHGWSF